jgi:hypothetical protein
MLNRDFTRVALSIAYDFRAVFKDFLRLIREEYDYGYAADILEGRFETAFALFLDAPTADRLNALTKFCEDVNRVKATLKERSLTRP